MKHPVGRGLRLAQALWVVMAVGMAALWMASLPGFLHSVATETVPTVAVAGAIEVSNDLVREYANAWGISPVAWSWLNTLVAAFSLLVFYILSALILWRVPTWFGWFTATILLLTGSVVMEAAIYAAQLSQPAIALWRWGSLVWPFFFLWLYLFPDGRPVPRGLLWLFGPALTGFLLLFLAFNVATFVPLSASALAFYQRIEVVVFEGALIPVLFCLALVAQVYRNRKVSGRVEREQVKWFIYGLLVMFVPVTIIELAIPIPAEGDTLFFLAIPTSIAIAILRYRLWDVDVIIRRTLVYSLLTALLALAYFGSIILLQQLFTGLTGQQSPLALVLSTLAIAALFAPVRRRVQDVIDRRFYRRKYDAAKALAAFAATVRDETDLDRLTASLLATVQETVQPESVTLWLREPRQQAGP